MGQDVRWSAGVNIHRGFDHYRDLDEGLVDHGIEITFECLLSA